MTARQKLVSAGILTIMLVVGLSGIVVKNNKLYNNEVTSAFENTLKDESVPKGEDAKRFNL